jgi:hypothetical protein
MIPWRGSRWTTKAERPFVVSETAVQRRASPRFWSLSERELQGQLVVLAFVLWGLAALNTLTPGLRDRSGQVKGADFVHFYVLGALVAEGHPDLLYDTQAQRLEQERLIPASHGTWFVPIYGPQTALLFAPLSRLPYLWAAAVWAVLTALVYGACVWIFWRDCPSLHARKRLVVLAAIAFPPFWSLISHGQTSVLALLCVTVGWLALRADRRWWAGLALGSLIIKPQLGVAIAVAMIARREWRVVGGALAAIAVQWGIAILVAGLTGFRAYLAMLLHARELAPLLEPKPFQLHSLRGFWTLLCPEPTVALALYLASSVVVVVLVVVLWRRSVPLEVRYSALLLATVLIAPHLTVYELTLLAPAFLLTAEAIERAIIVPRRALRGVLYFAYSLPLAGPLASLTHVQLSVPLLVGWLVGLQQQFVDRQRP